jgi:hypothetical protein
MIKSFFIGPELAEMFIIIIKHRPHVMPVSR